MSAATENSLSLSAVRLALKPDATTAEMLEDAMLLLLRAEAIFEAEAVRVNSEAHYGGLTLLRMGIASLGGVRA